MPWLRGQDRRTFEAAQNQHNIMPDQYPRPNREDYGWYDENGNRQLARHRRDAHAARERQAARVAPVQVGIGRAEARERWPAPPIGGGWNLPMPEPEPAPPAPQDDLPAGAVRVNAEDLARFIVPNVLARRAEPEMANNRQYLKDYPELNLDKIADGPKIIRSVSLPPFKVEYDSHEQISQKLRGSVIMIKDNPFHVVETIDAAKGFALLVRDFKGVTSWIMYEAVKDFRGIAPGYVNYQNAAYWVYRVPERQNRQGMTNANTQSRLVGTMFTQGARNDFLLTALSVRKDIPYAPNLAQLIDAGALNSIRLSNEIALFKSKTKGAPVGVEYLGRNIGLIVKDQVKVLDENDLIPSWINKDFMSVNLSLVA